MAARDFGPAYMVTASLVTRVGKAGKEVRMSSEVRVPRRELPRVAREALCAADESWKWVKVRGVVEVGRVETPFQKDWWMSVCSRRGRWSARECDVGEEVERARREAKAERAEMGGGVVKVYTSERSFLERGGGAESRSSSSSTFALCFLWCTTSGGIGGRGEMSGADAEVDAEVEKDRPA